MTQEQFLNEEKRMVRRYQYDDQFVVVADLGVTDADVDIDVLDDRALVVFDDGSNVAQLELQLPEGAASRGFINNGVVTIEVEQ